MSDLPVVLLFAPHPVRLQTLSSPHLREARELDCRCYISDENLNAILSRERPDVIASFGNRDEYPRLQSAPYEVQSRWLHFEADVSSRADLERAGAMVFCLFLHRVFGIDSESTGSRTPLVSVFTPTFRTGERIHRAYRSLQLQTYNNWEWVVVDDSDDGGTTLQILRSLAEAEPRLSVHSLHRHSGRIGELKRRACALSRGGILVELDHDDELTPYALFDIVRVLQENSQVGFVYSDWAEVDEGSRKSLRYDDGWAFGYGSYRTEVHSGQVLLVANAPPLNAQTIRHIVGVPNHVRAWRRGEYWKIGGHNPGLHVADDYELLLRTFLHTHMEHIPKLCYIQYLNTGGNTQDVRRDEIQRLVRCIREHYDRQIHERLLQLNLPDPIGGSDDDDRATEMVEGIMPNE